MRVFAGCIALCLIGSPVLAAGNNAAGNAAADPTPATASASSPAPAQPETVTAESEMQQLKDLIQAQSQQLQEQQQELKQQQQEMEALKQMVNSSNAPAPGTVAAPVATAAVVAPVVGAVAANSAASAQGNDINARVSSIEKQLGVLSALKFSGDLRLRYEPFFGGGAVTAAAPQDRHRERYRLRFNMTTKVAPDFTVGFSLASGDLGDPVSTNSTETGFYTRKPIAVDKAFGTYNPAKFKPFTLTVGKFGYTWLRTELTWDNDLNPEGASEAFSWDWKNKLLSHAALVAFQTPIFEVGGGPDTYMIGGQLQTGWQLASPIKFTLDGAYYDFGNADTIAQNQGQNPGNGFATQGIAGTGGSNFGFSASTLTNNFGVIAGKRVFASKYGIVDALARLDFDTGVKRWPVYALFDFAQNTQACGNIQAFVAAAVTPPTCDPHQRHGYWTELKAGQTKNPGDLLVGYTFARIERDAVLSAFDFSDLRQPTNVVEHRVEASYQAWAHVQFGFTGLIGRSLQTAQSPTAERFLKRYQFDTVFTF